MRGRHDTSRRGGRVGREGGGVGREDGAIVVEFSYDLSHYLSKMGMDCVLHGVTYTCKHYAQWSQLL